MRVVDVVRLRDEVVRGEIYGWVNLRGIFEGERESDPNYIFGMTYPSVEIRDLLRAVGEKLRGVRKTGFFILMGGYGTGKSHILCLLYHLFKNPGFGGEWLRENGIDLDLPKDSTVLAFSLFDEPPEYLWEPIFRGLGREDLLDRVKVFPGIRLLKEALRGKGVTVIIMDEVESWYSGVEDKENNLNFLQVLSEVACEEGSNLLVFCALYGEVKEVLGRVDRVEPYKVNLTLSKDREKIVLFRLVSDVDRVAVSNIVRGYMRHYRGSEVEILNPPFYERRMVELYPLHPELVDVLLTRYSSSRNYQNTRGVLCLLASVLSKRCGDVDLILASDVDMSEDDLLSLDRVLVENAQKDAEAIGEGLARSILNTILLYSFGEGEVGASRGEVILGTLRPGMNVNDLDLALSNLPNIAPHVWVRDDRYVIGYEANIVTLIQSKAVENIESGKIEDALNVVKNRLKLDLSYLVYHPDPKFGDEIEDVDRVRVIVSLKALNRSEINEFYKGRTYANRLILYVPKSGDLTRDEDILVIAERLRLCGQYEGKVSEENRELLERLKIKDERALKSKLSDFYGSWVKVTGFEDGEVRYRLVSCGLNEVKSKVRESYDVETIQNEVLRHLEDKEDGLRLEEIKHDFKITPGKPIILVSSLFDEAVRSLYRKGEIVIEYRGKYIREPDPLPPLKDTMKLILSRFAPPPEEVVEEEEERPTRRVRERPGALPSLIGVEVKRPEVEVAEKREVTRIIETGEHLSPYQLSVEVERKIREGARVKGIELTFSGISFEDFSSFLKFVRSLDVGRPQVLDVGLRLVIEGPMDKGRVIKLLDKLPPSLGGGNVKAVIEVEEVA